MIFQPAADQEVWVVRCQGGAFYRHFREHGLVSIGHLNGVIRDELSSAVLYKSLNERTDLLASHLAKSKELTKNAIAARVNTVHRFVENIKPGDLVVTTDGGSSISVGRVLSNAIYDESPIEINPKFAPYELPVLKHGLRRRVAWGPSLQRKNWPVNVKRALTSNLAVFNLGEHKKAIYHLLYPFFQDQEGLNTTININQLEDIDNFSVSSLFRFLSRIEALSIAALELDDGKISTSQLASRTDDLLFELNLNLTSKAQFMSEGDIQSKLQDKGQGAAAVVVRTLDLLGRRHARRYVYFVTALTIIGGNEHLGYPGLVDKEMISKAGGAAVYAVEALAKQMWEEEKGVRIASKLKPELPTVDTRVLTDSSNDEVAIAR